MYNITEYTHAHTYMYTHKHTHAHISRHTHTHTHISTHTHTNKNSHIAPEITFMNMGNVSAVYDVAHIFTVLIGIMLWGMHYIRIQLCMRHL